MNILVTGAGGFLGGALAEYLSLVDNRVFGLLHDKKRSSVFGWTPLTGDIEYRRLLEIIVDCEIDQIYHCAAKSIVCNCNSDPTNCFHVNVMGTANLLEAARQSGRVRGIMCMESDKAYGPGPVPYSEDQTLQPTGIYEASKSCVSHLISSYHATYSLPVFGIRSANIYGPGDRHESRIVPGTVLRLLRGEQPVINEGADNYSREYIYVQDSVTLATLLMEVGPWGRSVNVGSGEMATVSEVIERLCKLLGKPFTPEVRGKPATFIEIKQQYLDLTCLNALVPMFVPTSLEAGLQKTIDWYVSQ